MNTQGHLPLLVAIAGFASAPKSWAQIRFEDVTAAAGVDYLHGGPVTTQVSEITAMSGGAAAADYDGDGWVDLIVTRLDEPTLLFRNLGRGPRGHRGFADRTEFAFRGSPPGPRSNAVTWLDVEGDGDLDLYVTSLWTQRYHLWINDGNGRFREEGLQRGVDLTSGQLHFGVSVAVGDYDLDGYLDLYVSEWGHPAGSLLPSHSRLLRNRGSRQPGFFEDVTGPAGVSVESPQGVYGFAPRFSDLDDDGWPDLAIAADFGTSQLFWNNGDGTFLEGTQAAGVGTDENGMGSTIGDFNGDGLLDWFVTSIFDPAGTCDDEFCNWGNSGNRLYLNNGDRTFTDATDSGVRDGDWGWAAVDLDADHDGDLDIAMTGGVVFAQVPYDNAFNEDPMAFFRNDGGRFTETASSVGLTDTGSGKGMLSFDYDRDGDLDLFVVNNAGHPVLYQSQASDEELGHWLQIKLRGAGPNTRAIGARLTLFRGAGALPQVREMDASSNFLGQDEALAHFGLGDSDQPVERLEVRWPDGSLSVWTDLPTDRAYVFQQR